MDKTAYSITIKNVNANSFKYKVEFIQEKNKSYKMPK